MRKTHTASSLADRSGFYPSPTAGIVEKQDPFEKIRFGQFQGGKLGVKNVGWKNWILDHCLGSREQNTGGSYLLNGLKGSRNYSEATETLGFASLTAWEVMAINGAWKLLSHLVDILILFPNTNFPVNILAWNLLGCCKTPKYTFFASLVVVVATG